MFASVALMKVSSLFFSEKDFFSICWEFFLIRCEVKGQVCVQTVKLSEENLYSL